MKIEAGKKYTTRGLSVVGPMLFHERTGMLYTQRDDGYREHWYPTGVYCTEMAHHLDLVEESVDKTNWLKAGKWYTPQSGSFHCIVTSIDGEFANLLCKRTGVRNKIHVAPCWTDRVNVRNVARVLFEIECPFK